MYIIQVPQYYFLIYSLLIYKYMHLQHDLAKCTVVHPSVLNQITETWPPQQQQQKFPEGGVLPAWEKVQSTVKIMLILTDTWRKKQKAELLQSGIKSNSTMSEIL